MDLKEAGWQGVDWIVAQDRQGLPETSGAAVFGELNQNTRNYVLYFLTLGCLPFVHVVF